MGYILFLAIGLAMDAVAVAATRGFVAQDVRPRDVLAVGVWFGGFQAGMPLLGYVLGRRVGPVVQAFDHWIAFGILAALGVKMIHEAFTAPNEGEPHRAEVKSAFGARILIPLALATSIDALAAGLTLPLVGAPLLVSLATIGLVTAGLSALGVFAGRRYGAALGPRLDVFGGLVLVALGTKTLLTHLVNGT
jgi:manganese efflux pump family protein